MYYPARNAIAANGQCAKCRLADLRAGSRGAAPFTAGADQPRQCGQPAPGVASQATPLVVGGRMFLTTPYGRAVALNPATGEELWSTEVPGVGQLSLRGVEYWVGDTATPPRVVFGTRGGRLVALW